MMGSLILERVGASSMNPLQAMMMLLQVRKMSRKEFRDEHQIMFSMIMSGMKLQSLYL